MDRRRFAGNLRYLEMGCDEDRRRDSAMRDGGDGLISMGVEDSRTRCGEGGSGGRWQIIEQVTVYVRGESGPNGPSGPSYGYNKKCMCGFDTCTSSR